MRIIVEGSVFQNNNQRGIQRYCRELFSRLSQSFVIDLLLDAPAKSDLPGGCNVVTRRENFPAHRINIPLRGWRKLQRMLMPTRFSGHSLYHSVYFTSSPEPVIPQVMTLHDMIPESFPHFYPDNPQIAQKFRSMESASKIICISHATAAEAERFYPQFKHKLVVIHHGADHFLAGLSGKLTVPTVDPIAKIGQYVLFVGERANYKNFDAMVAAVGDSMWPKDIALLVVGRQTTAEELKMVQDRSLQTRIHFEGFVSDAQLKRYYQDARAFVFPSLGEGFGFPILEAQSLRLPVLCSDIAAFHEVAGDTAIFFDPNNPSSIASAVRDVCCRKVQIDTEAGLQNVSRFKWDSCAQQTGEVYRTVTG